MTGLSFTCPAGGGLREVCAAVSRRRRLLWGLVHLDSLHWDLLGYCPTYETQNLPWALSCPVASCTRHTWAPQSQGLAHSSSTSVTIFLGTRSFRSQSSSPVASSLLLGLQLTQKLALTQTVHNKKAAQCPLCHGNGSTGLG